MCRRRRCSAAVSSIVRAALCAAVLAIPAAAQGPASAPPFGSRPAPPPRYDSLVRTSRYLPMRDGVRIAADIYLPAPLAAGTRLPTIFIWTRYWRARDGQTNDPLARFYTAQGYAVVRTDERGSGASFGQWPHPWTRAAIEDAGQVVDWIVAQPWSNGAVGSTGGSYDGTTAELLAATGRSAVKVVMPKANEFDVFSEIIAPGGVFNAYFIEQWSEMTRSLDRNVPRGVVGGPAGVRPVDGDSGRAWLAQAIAEHDRAPEFFTGVREMRWRDDVSPTVGARADDFSVHGFREAIDRSGAFVAGWGSWLDGATADAALRRFRTLQGPHRAVIGSWSHSGRHETDPFAPADQLMEPSPLEQRAEDLQAFDFFLRGEANGYDTTRTLLYVTMGERRWKRTTVWPPAGTTQQRWYLQADGGLAPVRPAARVGADEYRVDTTATTGPASRWRTQLGGGDVIYPDRAVEDTKLLTYTSAPLEADAEITGEPELRLFAVPSVTDAAVFAYLEAVAPDGRVLYLDEGVLRGSARRIATGRAPYVDAAPRHSLRRADARPLRPGRVEELPVRLFPTSVLVPKGYRLRIAIAGADADNFERLPAQGTAAWQVQRNARHASYLELPIVLRGARSGVE